ncbi:conserved hypothetical protein [Ricinus communis]|uniref:Uncharacterized protein n=1 Tax=Ricinus communis TaxID=3988 RepID=B9T143_RICCO|nr:conserved hypothetical protein [Ricinus communis]
MKRYYWLFYQVKLSSLGKVNIETYFQLPSVDFVSVYSLRNDLIHSDFYKYFCVNNSPNLGLKSSCTSCGLLVKKSSFKSCRCESRSFPLFLFRVKCLGFLLAYSTSFSGRTFIISSRLLFVVCDGSSPVSLSKHSQISLFVVVVTGIQYYGLYFIIPFSQNWRLTPTEIAPKNYAVVVAGHPKPTDEFAIYLIFRQFLLKLGENISILLGRTFPPGLPSTTCRSRVCSQELAYQRRSFNHSVRSKTRLHQALEQRKYSLKDKENFLIEGLMLRITSNQLFLFEYLSSVCIVDDKNAKWQIRNLESTRHREWPMFQEPMLPIQSIPTIETMPTVDMQTLKDGPWGEEREPDNNP